MKDKKFENMLYRDCEELFNYLIEEKQEAVRNGDLEKQGKLDNWLFALDHLTRFTKLKLPLSSSTNLEKKKEVRKI